MTRNWDDVSWIFEPDGSLIDLYIQDTTLSDWEKLLDFLNVNYELKFGDNHSSKIDKKYITRYFKDETGEMENKVLRINLNGFDVNCYFFLSEQIEFDIDPKEIKFIEDFEKIEKFMISISELLANQVTLTAESTPKFPLIKIDVNKGINKVLTQNEAIILSKNKLLFSQSMLLTRIKMKLFPKLFKKHLIESANAIYKPTGKNENLW